jgi:hypothetical protein
MTFDPDAVAGAALSCAGVIRLSGGFAGEVATYLPGRRVLGVRLSDDHLEVHIVTGLDSPLPDVADRVRAAVSPLVDHPVWVFIDDVETAPIAALPPRSAAG